MPPVLTVDASKYKFFESLPDKKEKASPSEKNVWLADKLYGSWNGVAIALIVRIDGDPKGRWDSYTKA